MLFDLPPKPVLGGMGNAIKGGGQGKEKGKGQGKGEGGEGGGERSLEQDFCNTKI